MITKKKGIRFSIVIPVAPYRNVEVINSLRRLDYPKYRYEVIIEKGSNPSNNRNQGVRKARGKIIIFLDDDAYVPKNFLKSVEEFFKLHSEIDIVGGPQLTPKDDKPFAKISGYALASLFGGWKLRVRYKKGKMNLNADEKSLTSANLCCKKDIFKKIKFNPLLFPGEDPAFIDNAKTKGLRVAYSPSIFVYHRRRPTFLGLAKQIFNYGKTRPKKEKFIETIKRPFFIIPSLFFAYILILPSLLLISRIFLLPFLMYVLINLIVSLFISVKEKDSFVVFLLPLIFFIIHISYGAGMLIGLLMSLKDHKDKA